MWLDESFTLEEDAHGIAPRFLSPREVSEIFAVVLAYTVEIPAVNRAAAYRRLGDALGRLLDGAA